MQIGALPVVTQNAKNLLDANIAECNYSPMTRPARPPAVARAPRPWLSRDKGECAFPVAGEGLATLACCNPSGARAYCPAHRRAVLRRPTTSAANYETEIVRWLEEGR
jgi:hypothetical protein